MRPVLALNESRGLKFTIRSKTETLIINERINDVSTVRQNQAIKYRGCDFEPNYI